MFWILGIASTVCGPEGRFPPFVQTAELEEFGVPPERCAELPFNVSQIKHTQVEVPDRKSMPFQTQPDGKCLCPDYRAFKIFRAFIVRSKIPMSRLSCVPTQNSCAPKFIVCAYMSRLSCVQKTLCPDFCAFKIAYVQNFVRSKPKFMRSNFFLNNVNYSDYKLKVGYLQALKC